MGARIFAHLTADFVPADDGSGRDAAETVQHGRIDPRWSMTVLHDSRNDATPVVDCDEDDEDLAEYVAEALAALGPFEHDDDSFYGQAETVDEEGGTWTYALHFRRKHRHPVHGWVEDPWDPADHGIPVR
jgi:hypothetical protein